MLASLASAISLSKGKNPRTVTEMSPNVPMVRSVNSFGWPVMEEDDDKTVIQTNKDKILLRQELFGDDFEDMTESDTELDITRTDCS